MQGFWRGTVLKTHTIDGVAWASCRVGIGVFADFAKVNGIELEVKRNYESSTYSAYAGRAFVGQRFRSKDAARKAAVKFAYRAARETHDV